MNNNHTYLFIDAIIVLICLLVTSVIGYKHVANQQRQATYLNREINYTESSYDNKANQLDKKLASKIKYKVSPNQSAWDLFTSNQYRLNGVTQRFFSIYYNYNSDKQAQQRLAKMQSLATQKCLHNSKLFGYSVSGDNNQIISSLNSVDNYIYSRNNHYIQAISDVTYHAKKKGFLPNEGEKWYLITYDKHTNKLSRVVPFYRNVNTQQNIDAIQ